MAGSKGSVRRMLAKLVRPGSQDFEALKNIVNYLVHIEKLGRRVVRLRGDAALYSANEPAAVNRSVVVPK